MFMSRSGLRECWGRGVGGDRKSTDVAGGLQGSRHENDRFGESAGVMVGLAG